MERDERRRQLMVELIQAHHGGGLLREHLLLEEIERECGIQVRLESEQLLVATDELDMAG